MRIKPIFLFLTCFAVTSESFAQSLDGPESLEFDHRTGSTYISNKGASPGQILKRDSEGTLTLFRTLTGSGQPHGLRIAGDAIYVATGGTIQAFRLLDAEPLPTIPVPGASFLNGMATDGRERLWVSDFSGGRIHAIDLSVSPAVVTTLIPAVGFTPNGLDYDAKHNRLLVAGWGANARIAEVPLDTGEISEPEITSLGNLDGIALDCAGNLYVSSWGSSALLRFDAPVFSTPPVTVLPSLAQPSDIRFVRHGGAVLVPNYGSDSISTHVTDCLFDDSFQ